MTIMNLQSTIRALQATATFTPESQAGGNVAETEEAIAALVAEHRALSKFQTYLDFLRLTGGAHIHNAEFSLGIYGFNGNVVTSFDEGLFVDNDRYFHFGEVLYHQAPEPVFVFAFDLQAASDVVLTSPIEQSAYVQCASSFVTLLADFARGVYPNPLV